LHKGHPPWGAIACSRRSFLAHGLLLYACHSRRYCTLTMALVEGKVLHAVLARDTEHSVVLVQAIKNACRVRSGLYSGTMRDKCTISWHLHHHLFGRSHVQYSRARSQCSESLKNGSGKRSIPAATPNSKVLSDTE